MVAKEAMSVLRSQLVRGTTGSGAKALFARSAFINKASPRGLATFCAGSDSASGHAQPRQKHAVPLTPAVSRPFSTSNSVRARLADDQPPFAASFASSEPATHLDEAKDGIWASLGGETAKAIWRQAKARVEAQEKQRGECYREIRMNFRTWRPAAFRSCPNWRAKHRQRCNHGWSWSSWRSHRLFGRDRGSRCGGKKKKDGRRSGEHIAPVAGCRPAGPGWGWYLTVNERRRRDPNRRAEFRHVYRTLHPYAPDPGPGCFTLWRNKHRHDHIPVAPEVRASCEGAIGTKRFKRTRDAHYASRERAVRRVKRIVMRFCAESPNNSWRRAGRSGGGGAGSRSRGHDSWHSRARRSLHNSYQGRHEFVDSGRPFREGKRGASRIQAGVGTDEYRSALIMSVHSASLNSRSRFFHGRPRLHMPFAERVRSVRTSSRAFSATTVRRSNPLVNMLPIPGTLPCAPVIFCPLELALPLLVPLATILKSSAALNSLAAITRISLTLLPLSVRGKILHTLRERYMRDPASISSSIWSRLTMRAGGTATLETPSSFLTRWNAMVGLPLLLLTPLFMLALVAIASLERTPITGRWRIVMLSPAEEAELVDSVLSAGPAAVTATGAPVAVPEGTSRDWVQILRQVLQLPNEGVSSVTGRRILLGGEVLDQRDWRVRWTEAVLLALEKGGTGALDNDAGSPKTSAAAAAVLRPPPTDYPLEPRPEALSHQEGWRDELVLAKPFEAHHAHKLHAPLVLDYDLLVVENDAVNAFSFGFGPGPAHSPTSSSSAPKRGVVVVYTGFLREILGHDFAVNATAAPMPESQPARRSLLSGFKKPVTPAPPPAQDPIAAHLVPPTLPTDAQTKALAVLLSHELAHLALSHTLESYASTSLLLPHLARLTTDVIRTVLYPVTAIFGPFLNDALGGLLNDSARGGLGVVGQAVNSCESRKLESEADVVALRLLAAAGIDPRFALSFWEERVATSLPAPTVDPSSSKANSASPLEQPHPLRLHSKHDTLDGLMRSHPVDADRVQRIREELADWERWWSSRQDTATTLATA
ncbi:hypothetical protein JCM10908_000231 [Rhodotorula pacifica]|uniref:uncharacterized protein n=1 Tax=Rhodotorula pacifica TaxID=1495444 RepID=UPI00317359BC